MSAVQMGVHAACDHEDSSPPCGHNHWSDLRTRKNIKMMLCHVCLAKWKLCACRCARSSCNAWAKRGSCTAGTSCPKLHVGHARPRAQRGETPAVDTPFTDAPLDLDSVPAHPSYSAPEHCHGEHWSDAECYSGEHSYDAEWHYPEFYQQHYRTARHDEYFYDEPFAPSPSWDYGNLPSPSGPQMPPLPTPPSVPSTTPRSEALSPSSSGSLRRVDWWAPPVCISACGEYLEVADGYEPKGMAMTEAELDAHLRRYNSA